MPEAPMGFDDSTPPEQFQGMSPPSRAVAPASVSFHPSPSAAKPEVLEPHRLEPREGHVDLGHVDLPPGLGDARLAVDVGRAVHARLGVHLVAPGEHGGLRAHGHPVDPRRRAGATPRLSATRSLASTMAAAPSDDGHVSR